MDATYKTRFPRSNPLSHAHSTLNGIPTPRGRPLLGQATRCRLRRPSEELAQAERPGKSEKFSVENSVSSMIEEMVLMSDRLSARRAGLLATLLRPPSNPRCRVDLLRPIWSDEAMHRAYNLILLIQTLDDRSPQLESATIANSLEDGNAVALAAGYSALHYEDADEIVSCSDLLRTVFVGLIELFGPAIADITATTHLIRLSMPALKRRALVLACSELTVDVLQFAFPRGATGSISMTLETVERARARLTLVITGGREVPHEERCGTAIELAALLDGELSFGRMSGGCPFAEITFPCAAGVGVVW